MINKSIKLEEIYKPITKELSLMETTLEKQINNISENKNATRTVMEYFFNIPGKRLRPALVILSAKSCSSQPHPQLSTFNSQLILLATIVEFIHSASLIHDDIIDESEYRRDQITLNKKFSNQIAVLAGDLTYTYALSLLANNFDKKIMKTFLKCIEKMCQGEIYNLSKTVSSYKEYLKIIKAKTAYFMSACCKTGALLIDSDEKKVSMLEQFGLNFGIGYQLIDDYVDNEMPDTFEINNIDEAKKYISKAKDCIEILGDSKYKKSLYNLSEFVIFKGKHYRKKELVVL